MAKKVAKKTIKKRKVEAKPSSDAVSNVPDFLDADLLSRFVSERGRIHSRSRTGLSAKDQRRLTRAIKRARYLALLPFTVKPR